MEWFDQLKKKLKKEFEKDVEIDEGSDLPIHERFTKQEDIQSIKEKQKKKQKR